GLFSEEARSDDDVGVARLHRREKRQQPARVVLAVRVNPKHVVVAHAPSELETGLDGATYSQVERMTEHECPGPPCYASGLIYRPVVDDEDVCLGNRPPSPTDDVADAQMLVEGWDDHEKRRLP